MSCRLQNAVKLMLKKLDMDDNNVIGLDLNYEDNMIDDEIDNERDNKRKSLIQIGNKTKRSKNNS